MKRIVCPHCHAAHKPHEGYSFDENLSMICNNCNKIIFPTNGAAEVGIPKTADQHYNHANRVTFA